MKLEEKNLKIMSKVDNYNRWIYNNLKDYIGNRILEIGCGIGGMTKFFINKELIVGIDINKSNIKKIINKFDKKKNFKVLYYDISKNSNKLKKYNFDTIMCINVLEHIKDDTSALNNMYKVLHKNGKLILHVPAHEWLYGSIDKSDNHYRRYNCKKLRENIKKSGFRIIRKKYMNFIGMLGWYYHGKILKIKIHDENDLSIFNKFVSLLEFIENIISPPVGLSLIFICKKNERK